MIEQLDNKQNDFRQFVNRSQLTDISKLAVKQAISRYIQIFLLCPRLRWRERLRGWTYFFRTCTAKLNSQQVFLDEQHAFEFNRFLGNNQLLIKAYVPEQSIEADSQGLKLKPDTLKATRIHGCLMRNEHHSRYVANPLFRLNY